MAQPTNRYLRTKVMTASPQQLRLMLYDGAIKFARQGKHALAHGDYEAMYNGLTRAKKIVLELSTSLDHDAAPELCQRLEALYDYIYRRLVDANLERDAAAIDEALELLDYERETWRLAMESEQAEADGQLPSDAEAAPTAQQQNPLASIGPQESGDSGGFSTEG